MSLTDQLRRVVQVSGLTLYRISKDSGVPYAMLFRFAQDEKDIRLATADRLASYFGVQLTKPVRRRKWRRKG